MNNNSKKPELLYQIIYDATRDKFAILPILSGLLLALVSFGVSGGLFPLNDIIRGIVTILLLLMILSIQIYYSETITLLIKAKKKFYEHFRTTSPDVSLSFVESIKYLITGKIGNEIKEKDFFKRFSSQFPAVAILILWVIIFLIIYEIWC